jgi:hypothetical protein
MKHETFAVAVLACQEAGELIDPAEFGLTESS